MERLEFASWESIDRCGVGAPKRTPPEIIAQRRGRYREMGQGHQGGEHRDGLNWVWTTLGGPGKPQPNGRKGWGPGTAALSPGKCDDSATNHPIQKDVIFGHLQSERLNRRTFVEPRAQPVLTRAGRNGLQAKLLWTNVKMPCPCTASATDCQKMQAPDLIF